MELQRQRILPTNIEDEMKDSYLDYSMSVIIARALPDRPKETWCVTSTDKPAHD